MSGVLYGFEALGAKFAFTFKVKVSNWHVSATSLTLDQDLSEENITAEIGQTVTLPCHVPQNRPVLILEWVRADLGTEYVFFLRDDQPDPENQNPSFTNRVQLKDRNMKNGDLSLVLKDVTIDDRGKYECHIVLVGANRGKRASFDTEPIKIIHLEVRQPANRRGRVGLAVGLTTLATLLLVLVAAFGVVIFRNCQVSKKPTSFQFSVDEEFRLQ
ncbi:hypothetical protein Q5P01_000304 [Channa striata]|uniref:Ig-like domain-containing protein n=1 Tax=Channa striata TaxID=64152 RepID=A0AA88IIH5_CHASR|nr:hypothetical protein Q5P01_000304 [Channa striata]